MQPCPDVGGEFAPLVAEGEPPVEHRIRLVDLAAPDRPLARYTLGRLRKVTGNGRRCVPSLTDLVERLSEQGAGPGEREEDIPLYLGACALRCSEHLERARLGVGDP